MHPRSRDPLPAANSRSTWRRAVQHPVARMVVASLAMFLMLALGFAASEALFPPTLRVGWPSLLGALSCGLGYWLYVNRIERRPAIELAPARALPEWICGAGLGALIGLLTLAPLWAIGSYRLMSFGDTTPLLTQIPEMVLVSTMEEILMRAVVFRLARQAWGTRAALLLSSALFVAAHLPGALTLVGALVTAAASLAFTGAYMVSGRVWLPMGMHFAWNYLFSAVLSVPVSGHEAKGWIQASMSGADWLTGGAYGVEASVFALVTWSVAAFVLLRRTRTSSATG